MKLVHVGEKQKKKGDRLLTWEFYLGRNNVFRSPHPREKPAEGHELLLRVFPKYPFQSLLLEISSGHIHLHCSA